MSAIRLAAATLALALIASPAAAGSGKFSGASGHTTKGSVSVTKSGGKLVVKLFQGEGADAYIADARRCFENVKVRKPKASRPRSREVYLVARNYRV